MKDVVADFWDAQIYHENSGKLRDVEVAGLIMMELMHHKRPTNGKICALDSPRGADVMDFLAEVISGSFAAQLAKIFPLLKWGLDFLGNLSVQHSFLATPEGAPAWRPGQLQDLVTETACFAQVDKDVIIDSCIRNRDVCWFDYLAIHSNLTYC